MQSSDTSRALSQVKLLIEELNRFIEILRNAPPANNVSTREQEDAIDEATNLCLTLSTLENSGIFEICAAAIQISQLRALFIELRRYEICRKSIVDVISVFQENLAKHLKTKALTTNMSENLATIPPENHEKNLITSVEAKEAPKPHRFKKMIATVKKLGRNQQQVIKDKTRNSKNTIPNIVKEVDNRKIVDQPVSSQKELAYTVWKIRGVSSFVNGILADWVSTELRRPEPKWETWKIEVIKLAGWRSDIVVQSEPQKVSAESRDIVHVQKQESIKGYSGGEDDGQVVVLHKSQTAAAVSSYKSETAPAKCGRCLGFFNVEPRCVCH